MLAKERKWQIKVEINEIENRKQYRVSKTKGWFFVNINMIDKSLAMLTKEKKSKDVYN